MKIKLCLVLLFLTFQAQAVRVCTASTPHLEFCQKMKHLGTSINAIESQSVLMRLDPKYLSGMAESINQTTRMLAPIIPQSVATHKESFFRLNQLSLQLEQESLQSNPEMFVTANRISQTCTSCHSSSHPQGQMNWNQLFGNGWGRITLECNSVGKNPYLCKTMNAIAANYNHIVTASIAKIENYKVLMTNAREILRLLNDLGAKKFDHMGDANRVKAEMDTKEVMQLAAQKNPLAFEKARNLSQTCMQCHNQVASNVQRVSWNSQLK